MSDELIAESPAGVSPMRKKISSVLLIVLLIVLVIELRAGAGHMMTGKAFKAKAPDGAFEYNEVSYSDVLTMISLGPNEELIRESQEELEYRYSWFSLLRPLLSRPEAAYYVVFRTGDPKMAIRHGSEPPSEEELAYVPPEANGEEGLGDGGEGFGGGGEGFGGGGEGFGGGGEGFGGGGEGFGGPGGPGGHDAGGMRPERNGGPGEERPRRRPPMEDDGADLPANNKEPDEASAIPTEKPPVEGSEPDQNGDTPPDIEQPKDEPDATAPEQPDAGTDELSAESDGKSE